MSIINSLPIQLFIATIVSLYASNWIFPKILKIAKTKGLVDNPNARKLQKAPVPVMGGLVAFFGLLFGMLTFFAFSGEEHGFLMPLVVGAGIMLYVGIVDDIMGLTPTSRIAIEVMSILGLIYGSGMCVDSFHGLWGIGGLNWWIAVPLTIFAGVGLVNAYNMVDGVNGLSSGLCISVCTFLSIIFWKCQDFVDCALSLCYGASLIPFFLHNVFGKRSKMFIGDGGTMVMGFMVTWLLIRVLSSSNHEMFNYCLADFNMGLVAMMLAVSSVPVFDTIRVMMGRILRHESPFHADRTHLHHAFIMVGVSHSITALSEIILNALVVLCWYISYKLGLDATWQLNVTIVMGVVLVWGSYYFLNYAQSHNVAIVKPLMTFAAKIHFSKKSWWKAIQEYLDKGMYEDFLIVMMERQNVIIENLSEREKMAVTVVNHLQGRKKVNVESIVDNCNIERDVLDNLLNDLARMGVIDVYKRNDEGVIKEIKFNGI